MIWFCGDLHREYGAIIRKFNVNDHFGDILISTGDFAALWYFDDPTEEIYEMKQKLWFLTILVVPGNHENYDLIEQYEEFDYCDGKAREILPGLLYLSHGHIFDIPTYDDIDNINKSRKIFIFGGGLSIDKYSRIEGQSWWPQEYPAPVTMQFVVDNLANVKQLDYIVTHVAPKGEILDDVVAHCCIGGNKKDDSVSHFLGTLINLDVVPDYKHWICGHYHESFQQSSKFRVLGIDEIVSEVELSD